MMLYRVRNLKKEAGSRTLLDIDTLALESGKIYGLLGANGAGKTTLLNILAFLDLPTSGSMEFAGRPVRLNASGIQPLRREVVLVDQHPVLFSSTVYKNIEFGLKIRKIDPCQRERIIDEVLAMVDLAALKQQSVHGLSGGEIQRVALARALALSPRVLLCDEPTASVDVENQAAVAAILKEINATRGISIIFTTHDRLQAAALAHKTLVLERGSLVRTAYENVFACSLEKQQDNQVLYRLQGSVDLIFSEAGNNLERNKKRVSIDPEKITLLDKYTESGRAGTLQGRVVQLMADGGRVRMVVNTGVLITVLLESQRYRSRLPAIGDRVSLQVAFDGVY